MKLALNSIFNTSLCNLIFTTSMWDNIIKSLMGYNNQSQNLPPDQSEAYSTASLYTNRLLGMCLFSLLFY